MKKQWSLFLIFLIACVLVACNTNEQESATATPATTSADATTAPPVAAGDGSVMKLVKERGKVKCGSNAGLVGFGFLDSATNQFSGFDVDFCKAIAATVFGDATKYEITPASGTDRFPLLQSGAIDILIRNTTWTISRDTSLGFDFGPVTFYDGQGMMVRADKNITKLEDLAGSSICVQAGTTTEKNLADSFRALGLEVKAQTYPDNAATAAAYQQGLCDGFTTDISGLAATQTTFPNPAEHVILEAVMSKEPLGPLVRHGDNNWGDIMSWTVYCTIDAEEKGITSANVDEMMKSEDPVIRNLLGVEGELGKGMGVSNDFCYQVIKQVGNYGEIFDRNLGAGSKIGLERGINNLWTNGGLLYSPPFR